MRDKQTIFPILACIVFALIFGAVFFPTVLLKNDAMSVPDKEIKKTTSTTRQSSAVTHSLATIKSNQWYSPLNFSNDEPLYAFPLVYKVSSKGLGFSFPAVQAKENTISASYKEDFTVGLKSAFGSPEITSVGDWHVGVGLQTAGDEKMNFTLAQGIPYTTITSTGEDTLIKFVGEFSIFPENSQKEATGKSVTAQSLVIVTQKNNYIFSFPQEKKLSVSGSIITIPDAEKVFVGLLAKRDNYAAFEEIAFGEITSTTAKPQVNGQTLDTTYTVTVPDKTTLLTIFPHQYDFLADKPSVLGEYQTLRGPLRLVRANEFTSQLPLTVPPVAFDALSKTPADLKEQIKDDIADVIKKKAPAGKVYFFGTWLGTVSNLLLLADATGLDKERDALIKFVEPVFLERLENFSYDEKKTSLLASDPEFGHEKLNDHHFHYSYYIRMASVLGRLKPELLPKMKPQISEMVGDIANEDSQSEKYPYLRNFSVYEGHSWADGDGAFADGNNQESSSEAMNAWYSVYLWGKQIGDKDVENTALYLYNTELQSVNYYWFNQRNIYQDPYGHAIASMVWGGKIDFATWFSDKTNMKYGIQLLPFTPGSGYLGELENFEVYDADYKNSGGNEKEEWGDLFVMWKSFYAPEEMIKLKDTVKKFEAANTRSLFLYTLYKNLEK